MNFLLLLSTLLFAFLISATAQAATTTTTCPPSYLRWSNHCWLRKHSGNRTVGPGPNVFSTSNVWINGLGDLVLRIDRVNNKTWRCGEVSLDQSLGLGDYVFVLRTDPSKVDKFAVFAPFLYANDVKELDIEFSRWGDPDPHSENAQFTVQPYYRRGALKRYRMTGQNTVHRIRWGGSKNVSQIRFESWNAGSRTPLLSWTPTGGNNFVPGQERVHINFWLYKEDGANGPSNNVTNTVVMSCFKFCPLPGCSALGVKPTCP